MAAAGFGGRFWRALLPIVTFVRGSFLAQRRPAVLRGAVGEVESVIVRERLVGEGGVRGVLQLLALGVRRHVARAHPSAARNELKPAVGAVAPFDVGRLGKNLRPLAQDAEPNDLLAVDEHVAFELGAIQDERFITRSRDHHTGFAGVDVDLRRGLRLHGAGGGRAIDRSCLLGRRRPRSASHAGNEPQKKAELRLPKHDQPVRRSANRGKFAVQADRC